MRTLIALVLVLAASAASAQPPDNAHLQNVVVTSGEAVVRQAPDRAYVTITVEARAKSPRDAQRQNAEAMAAVLTRLGTARIAKEAIRTLGYSLDQEFDFIQGRRVPREFVARNSVEVRVDEIDSATCSVMAGLVPAIHVLAAEAKTWMPGSSPGMTMWMELRAPLVKFSTTSPL